MATYATIVLYLYNEGIPLMHRRLAFVIVPLIAIIMLAALAPGPVILTAQANKTVAVIDSTFRPASLSIAAGTTVTWTSSGATPHSSTSDEADWDSGQLSSQPFARTFTAPGSYAYHCTFHPLTMRGTITVVAPSYLPLVLGPNASAQASPTTTVQPSATATTKPSPTSTVQPSATATTKPSPTSTVQPSATATETSTPTAAGTSTPTATGTSTPTATGTSTPTATESAPSQYGIRGQVQVRPRWATTTVQGPPILYEIIMDASGSMNWSMAGQAGNVSAPLQCEPSNEACSGKRWEPVEERRIYIVKQALNGLIDALGPDDVMRITMFSGELSSSPYTNQRAIDATTKTLPSSGWSNDKAVLKGAVSDAGAFQGDPYRTTGRSPNAIGLAAATQVLTTAPTTTPNGLAYQRKVIFLTDSVANVFLNGKPNFARDICPQYTGFDATNTAFCQIGITADGQARPITAMVEQAGVLRDLADVYVVALAGVDTTGLTSVGSAPNYPFFSGAQSSGELTAALADIAVDGSTIICEPAGGDQWVSQIDVQHTAALSPPDTLPNGVYGYVYLYDENGIALPTGQDKLPIVHDLGSGLLTFELSTSQGLAPGTYQLRAFAGYKGQDAISRIYNGIFNPDTEMIDTGQSFTVDSSGAIGSVLVMDALHLDLIGEVCP
jgi:plastocyanin